MTVCYNELIKQESRLNQLKREAEPTGYCAEFGENPKLRPSREGKPFPSRMPPVSNIQEQICGSRVCFRRLGAGHSLSLSKSRNRSAVFLLQNKWIFKGLDLFLISTAFLFVKRRVNDEKN